MNTRTQLIIAGAILAAGGLAVWAIKSRPQVPVTAAAPVAPAPVAPTTYAAPVAAPSPAPAPAPAPQPNFFADVGNVVREGVGIVNGVKDLIGGVSSLFGK